MNDIDHAADATPLGDGGRGSGDAGGLTIEMALLTPLLFVLLIGILEFGLAWRDSMSIANSARAAARVASSAGDTSTADHQALTAITAGLENLPETEIEFVVIYDAEANDGTIPTVCRNLGASTNSVGGIPNRCNVYGGDWLRDTFDPNSTTLFEGQVGTPDNPQCASSRVDRAWCPFEREASQRAPGGLDYVGVYIATNHGWVTKLFGASGLDMADSAVMRIEPRWDS